MGDKSFIVFGGWNRTTMKKCAFVWHQGVLEYNIAEINELAKPDTFVSTGLLRRDPIKKECIVFGVSYCHKFNEVKETFSLIE